jgi:hypothetical protein
VIFPVDAHVRMAIPVSKSPILEGFNAKSPPCYGAVSQTAMNGMRHFSPQDVGSLPTGVELHCIRVRDIGVRSVKVKGDPNVCTRDQTTLRTADVDRVRVKVKVAWRVKPDPTMVRVIVKLLPFARTTFP